VAARGKNATVAIALGAVALGMVGLAYAAVPLYRLFCQVTGFGGTPGTAQAMPATVGERMVTIRFNADVDSRLPWRFTPPREAVKVRVGAPATAVFHARNLADKTITGTAAFNVTPLKVGTYFNKVECFCFTEQTLGPGESAELPVSFYVDPAIADDPAVREVHTITLSYTFFRRAGDAPAGGTAPRVKGSVGGPALSLLGATTVEE
jgi:cytochrome c oxidase assembly protein subunit 11